jgi:hypothetical protein
MHVTHVENHLTARTDFYFTWDPMISQRSLNVQFVRKCLQLGRTYVTTWGFISKNALSHVKYATRLTRAHMNWQGTKRHTLGKRTMSVTYVAMQPYTKLTWRYIRRDTSTNFDSSVMNVAKVITQTVSFRLIKTFTQARNHSNVMHVAKHTSTNTTW